MLTPESFPHRNTHTRSLTVRRRGMVSVIAMLFLVIFATLSIGFYASTTMSAQIASNDEKLARAQLAAESGMDFVRLHLASVNVPTSATPDEVLERLYELLKDRLEGTANLRGATVDFSGETIAIPAIDLGGRSQFSARIALRDPASATSDVKVTVTGRAFGGGETGATFDVSMDFAVSQRRPTLFDFGLATRSTVTMDSNARVHGITDDARGTILSTSLDQPALTLASNAQVTGKVSLVNELNTVRQSGNSRINGKQAPVAGTDAGADIELAIVEPEFPEVDTSMFRHYAGNPDFGGTTVNTYKATLDKANVKNVLIKAGTNPTFASNIAVEGVVYIEAPNKVTFSSNVQIRGVIVVENDPDGEPGHDNQITFNSNVTLAGLDALPETAHFPQALREMAGALILAPGFKVHMNSNFGSAGGHLAASQFEFDSNARGEIHGSVINLDDYPLHMDSNADLAFGESGLGHGPGMRFSGSFLPRLESYTEGL